MTDIVELLDQLAEIQAAVQVTRMDYDAKRTAILAQVKDQLDDLDAEYNPLLVVAQERVENLTAEIKTLVIAAGASIKGANLHAVYSRGRSSWDGKSLLAYAKINPEILAYHSDGEPSVTIRTVK